jgi:uncharacterized Zn-finger protein
MPRSFDSDDRASPLAFCENVVCPDCDTVFEGHFVDETDSITFEDMTDPPSGTHDCPHCQRVFVTEMTGWSFYSEAG